MKKTLAMYEREFEEAIAAGDLDAVEGLLPKVGKKKAKSIFRAIERADVGLAERLIRAGVPLEGRHFGGTPLLMAVFELTDIDRVEGFAEKKANLVAIITMLVRGGADVRAWAPDGVSVLHLASTLRDPAVHALLQRALAEREGPA
jgi:hypothetical protein